MKNNTRTLLLGLLLFSISCGPKTDPQVKFILEETEKEIKGYLDSVNHYFDLVITDHNKGISNSEIEKKYSRKIELLETKIDQAVRKPSLPGNAGKLSAKEYEKWVKGIDLSSFKEKHDKIMSLNINFDRLPVTRNYELKQHYSDSINHFSMSFPNNWTVLNNYQDYILIGTGPIGEDTSMQTKDRGGFGLDIGELGRHYSSTEYYNGNLKNLKASCSDLEIIEKKSIDLNGIDAEYVAFRCTMSEKSMTSVQVYFTNNTRGYVLSGTTLTEDFENSRNLYIEIARTFRIEMATTN